MPDRARYDIVVTPTNPGSNGAKVLSAPVTVVFAADLESGRSMPRVVALLRKAGSFPEKFLAKVCVCV